MGKKFAVGMALLALAGGNLALAQKCVNPHFDAEHLDYRDLGYPGATEIPADDSPIVALLAHSNGKIYGATTGKRSHLFMFDSAVNKVFPLGLLNGEPGVHHSIVEGVDGEVYLGTGLNEIELLTLTKDMPHGRRAIENQLWQDIQAKYKGYAGGHLYRFDPATADNVYLGDAPAKVQDLGIPVPGNSIYALVAVPSTTEDKAHQITKLFGLTYPDAEFFEYDGTKFIRHGKWLKKFSYPGPERSWRGLPRALAVDRNGTVWSSGDDGLLQGYQVGADVFVETHMRIPGEYWETQNYNAFPVVEQLFALADGSLTGTTSDGFIFTAVPAQDKLSNWGKMRVERRVRAATLGKDGRLYTIAGEKDNVCRLFSFRRDEGHQDWGVLGVDRSPYYAKIAYQFDAMCTGKDGTIFIGESDRRAKLFFFIPGAEVMPGVLNPTNPR